MPGIFDIFKTKKERKIICESCKAPIENYQELTLYATLGSFLFVANPMRERLVPFHRPCFEEAKKKAERYFGIVLFHHLALFPIEVISLQFTFLLTASLAVSTSIIVVEVMKLPSTFELVSFILSGFAFFIFICAGLIKQESYLNMELPLKLGLKGSA
jgi:hypothetical protein